MPLETQGKLRRVLVEQKFQRVGGGPKVQVDVRVVSSTSRDLEREMTAGRFRQDLYYRLNVHTLKVPPLRERLTDVPALIDVLRAGVSHSYDVHRSLLAARPDDNTMDDTIDLGTGPLAG